MGGKTNLGDVLCTAYDEKCLSWKYRATVIDRLIFTITLYHFSVRLGQSVLWKVHEEQNDFEWEVLSLSPRFVHYKRFSPRIRKKFIPWTPTAFLVKYLTEKYDNYHGVVFSGVVDNTFDKNTFTFGWAKLLKLFMLWSPEGNYRFLVRIACDHKNWLFWVSRKITFNMGPYPVPWPCGP